MYSVFAVAVMWAAWLIVQAAVGNDNFIAPFGASFKDFFALFTKAFFWKALAHTLLRTVVAFILSFALALACACLAAVAKPFSAFMRPIVALFRSLPTMAVLLLILVWLKPRFSPVAVAMLVLFPMIYSQLYSLICSVDGKLIEMAKVYNVPPVQRLKRIYLPQILPQTIADTGTNLSFGLKLIISAEVMASTYTAIGGMMAQAQAYINLPRIAALTLVAVLFGIVVELAFRALSVLPFKWKREERND